MRILAVLIVLGAWSGLARGAGPLFERHTVWSADEDGIPVYHVPTIFVTHRGTVLAAADARYRDVSDFGSHHLVVKRSIDEGRTWSANQFVARSDHGQIYLFPNFIEPREGNTIFLFYAEKVPQDINHQTRVWVRSSTDDGRTWGPPRDIVSILVDADAALARKVAAGTAGPQFARDNAALYGRRAFFPGPGVAIQLSPDNPVAANRVLVPVLGMKDRWVYPIQRGQFDTTIQSDDGGRTWRAGGAVPIGDEPNSEPSIVELDDGSVLLNARVEDRNFRMVSRSADGGANWPVAHRDPSLPEYGQIHSGLLRYSFSRTDPTHTSRVFFSFPDSPRRENLNVWVSYDDCRTWAVRRVIDPGPSFYSNMAMLPDRTVLLIYGQGRRPGAGPFMGLPLRTVVVRFNLEWLTGEKTP